MSHFSQNAPNWLARHSESKRISAEQKTRLYEFAVVFAAIFTTIVVSWNLFTAKLQSVQVNVNSQAALTQRDYFNLIQKLNQQRKQIDQRWTDLQQRLLFDQKIYQQTSQQIHSNDKLHEQLISTIDLWNSNISQKIEQLSKIAVATEKSPFQNASYNNKTVKSSTTLPDQARVEMQNNLLKLKIELESITPAHPIYAKLKSQISEIEKQLAESEAKSIDQANQSYADNRTATTPASPVGLQFDLESLKGWISTIQKQGQTLRSDIVKILQSNQQNGSADTSLLASQKALREFDNELKRLDELATTKNLQTIPTTQSEIGLQASGLITMLLISIALTAILFKMTRPGKAETIVEQELEIEPLTIDAVTRTLGSTPLGVLPVMSQSQLIDVAHKPKQPRSVDSQSPNWTKICRSSEVVMWSLLGFTALLAIGSQRFSQLFQDNPLTALGRWLS
jgi:hypothetical protein